MEIISENEEEIGVVFTIQEFRVLMELYGEAFTGLEIHEAWEKFNDWCKERGYDYIIEKDVENSSSNKFCYKFIGE